MKRIVRSRLWECWRDPLFVVCGAVSMFIIVGMPFWQQLYAPGVAAWQHPIATVPAVTAFILFWFGAHMLEVTWLAYDSFYWGVPHRNAWGAAVYIFGAFVLVPYIRSRTRQRRLQLQVQFRERAGA